jgi:hypothetical protein
VAPQVESARHLEGLGRLSVYSHREQRESKTSFRYLINGHAVRDPLVPTGRIVSLCSHVPDSS